MSHEIQKQTEDTFADIHRDLRVAGQDSAEIFDEAYKSNGERGDRSHLLLARALAEHAIHNTPASQENADNLLKAARMQAARDLVTRTRTVSAEPVPQKNENVIVTNDVKDFRPEASKVDESQLQQIADTLKVPGSTIDDTEPHR